MKSINVLHRTPYVDSGQKDSSQETIISLLGMLAGSLVVSHITTPLTTWLSLIILLSIHLGTNYLAVRSVSMRTLNRQRANLVFTTYLDSPTSSHTPDSPTPSVLSPETTSTLERIFERDGVLRWRGSTVLGTCSIGVPLTSIIEQISLRNKHTNSFSTSSSSHLLNDLLDLYCNDAYILWYTPSTHHVLIVLKSDADTETQLKAWLHALLIVKKHDGDRAKQDGAKSLSARDVLEAYLRPTRAEADGMWKRLVLELRKRKWDLRTGAMETRSGTRVRVAGAAGAA